MEKKLGIMFFLFALLLLQLSGIRTAQRPLQVDKEGNTNNNWAWATQADKASEVAQELSHVNHFYPSYVFIQ
ncbi:hypothetical protein EUTSA_v10015130mg [Eutrema salsugineum]|uniref:Pectate lyase N-terminal domain-containing protein n=1 Tax=Eutrema salsugineum TaxID=72664 RepID=V4N4H8_EUTSA|nr:hypothetical protein EUTSA_v10015130mg [Eutrema salsugineum]